MTILYLISLCICICLHFYVILVNDVWLSTASGIGNSYGWSWNIISGSNYTGDGSPVSYAAVNTNSLVSIANPGSALCSSFYNGALFDLSGQDANRPEIAVSTDGGQHWTQTATANFSRREDALCVTDPHTGYMLLLGGLRAGSEGDYNEVWLSTDASKTWILHTNAPWTPRAGLTGTAVYSPVLNTTIVYVVGGEINEVQYGDGQ